MRPRAVASWSSTAPRSGDERRLVRGNLVLRVPERSYSRVSRSSSLTWAASRPARLVRTSRRSSSTSKRGERHLEAVEGQLLNLLDETNTVAEALTVAAAHQVQSGLEQARGRLQYLEDQVAFATISLDVRERQVEAACLTTADRGASSTPGAPPRAGS